MTTKRTRFLALAAFLLAFTVAACDSDPSALADEEATATERNDLAARLSTDLGLSTEQARDINSLLAVAGDEKPEPGRLWSVAAALQKTLTDEQKATLFAQVEQRTADLADGMRAHRFNRDGQGRRFNRQEPRPDRRVQRQGERGPGFLHESLTPEQQAQMKALRETQQEKMKALHEARQNGSLSSEDFREQIRVLREANQEAMQALLTDEQKAALQEKHDALKARFGARKQTFDARRGAAMEARSNALGLTADQEAALATLHETHQAERKAFIEKIRNGDLDREAVKAEFEALHEAHKAALDEVLTPDQREIVEIYDALTGGVVLHRAGSRGRRGFGRRGR